MCDNENGVISKRLVRGQGYIDRQNYILDRLINAKNICNIAAEFAGNGSKFEPELEASRDRLFAAIAFVHQIQTRLVLL